MAAVTDEDLNEKRATLDELREQIAAEEAKKAAVVQAQTNQSIASELDIEEQRLRDQLARAQAETRRLVGEQAPSEPPAPEAPAEAPTEAPVVRDRSTPPTDPDESASAKNKK